MLVSAASEHDKREWIKALREHQIDTLQSRAKFFERKLERSGVRVPRASILVSKGYNAPLQNVAIPRTQSHGAAEMRPLLTDGSGAIVSKEQAVAGL